jgi:hypothetical protein
VFSKEKRETNDFMKARTLNLKSIRFVQKTWKCVESSITIRQYLTDTIHQYLAEFHMFLAFANFPLFQNVILFLDPLESFHKDFALFLTHIFLYFFPFLLLIYSTISARKSMKLKKEKWPQTENKILFFENVIVGNNLSNGRNDIFDHLET